MRYQPEHPAADRDGLVRYPNVNKIIEIADAKEAQTSFEANATSLEITKTNRAKILELMK
jgi:flagellar basal-body rod protein FlgC